MAKKSDIRTNIRTDLINQLNASGVYGSHYQNTLEDYMSFWDIKNKLIEDIEERGVSIGYNNGGGQCGSKKNDSVGELCKVNSQMLKILNDLGLRAVRVEPIDDGEM